MHWISAGAGLALGLFVGVVDIPPALHFPNRLDALLYAFFGSALLVWIVGGVPDLRWPRFEAFFFSLIVGVYLAGIGVSIRLAL
jgi:hypothetical protein